MRKDMTIVIIGYDGYSDIWNDCLSLFNHYWVNCPYKILFINNVANIYYDNVDVIHAGGGAEWSKKVQLALNEIQTPYICLLLEDFLIGDTVNQEAVDKVLNLIAHENIQYYKLANLSRPIKNHDPLYKDIDYLHIIPKSDEYGVSLQPAIWNCRYLKEHLGEGNYNAWIFEFNRVKESNPEDDSPVPGCVFDSRNILNLQHGIIQGKYLPQTIRYFKRKGIRLNVQRDVMSPSSYYKVKIITKCKYLVPRKWRKPIKQILERFGFKFVSTIRDK